MQQQLKLISRGNKGINQYVLITGEGKNRTSETKHMTEADAMKFKSSND